jgi:tRNA uridine 5-carbamoylmethylation protein Kti12
MSEFFLLQPFEANISSRTLCATIPPDVPLPAFNLFQEIRIAPDVAGIIVGLEYSSAERSEIIFENPDSEGWWCHIHWKFDVEHERNRRRADFLGHTWTEEYLLQMAERYERSQQAKAAESELLPIAS